MRKSEFVHQAVLNMLTNLSGESPSALGSIAKAHADHLEREGFKFDEEKMRFGG